MVDTRAVRRCEESDLAVDIEDRSVESFFGHLISDMVIRGRHARILSCVMP